MSFKTVKNALILGTTATLIATASFATGTTLELEPGGSPNTDPTPVAELDLSGLGGTTGPSVDISQTRPDIGASINAQLSARQGGGSQPATGADGADASGMRLSTVGRNVRIECPGGTELTATDPSLGPDGVHLDGYRWICAY